MSLELRLIIVMSGFVIPLGLWTIYEVLRAREAERQLESERWMHRGFKAGKRMGWISEDTQ